MLASALVLRVEWKSKGTGAMKNGAAGSIPISFTSDEADNGEGTRCDTDSPCGQLCGYVGVR